MFGDESYDDDAANEALEALVRSMYGDEMMDALNRVNARYDVLQPQVNDIVYGVGEDDIPRYTVTLTGRELATCLGGIGQFVAGPMASALLFGGYENRLHEAFDTASTLVAAYQGSEVPDTVPDWL